MYTIDWKIEGIPCRVCLATYERDCDGVYVSYDIQDSRGNPAPWLARKMDDQEDAAITAALLEYLRGE